MHGTGQSAVGGFGVLGAHCEHDVTTLRRCFKARLLDNQPMNIQTHTSTPACSSS